MDQQFVTELEATLRKIISPDNTAIQQASQALQNKFYKSTLIIPALIHILQSSPETQIRQLAGVEARKIINREWLDSSKISSEIKSQIKGTILASTLAEQDALVRHTSSRVISSIAKIDVEENLWPELLPALYQSANSSVAVEREVAIYIIFTLLEAELEILDDSTITLLELFGNTINDPESLQVRISTLLALGCIASSMESGSAQGQAELFRAIVPSMVEVLKQVISSNDEKSALQVFDVFTILLSVDSSLISKYLGDLINFMLYNIAAEVQLGEEFRIPALQFLISAVRAKKMKIQALKLGPSMVTTALKIVANHYREEDEDLEDEDEDEESNPASLSLQLIDNMSSTLPPSQVMAPLLTGLPGYVTSSDPADRKAGFMALAVAVEGAPDFVGTQIEHILPFVVDGLNDADLTVKVSALQCLFYLSAELRDLVSSEHEVLLPLVFNIMDTASALKVGKHACAALDALLESMDRKVITEKYLSTLVPKLLHLLSITNDLTLKGSIVAAISSAAFSAGKNFLPFFQPTITALEPFVGLTSNIDELTEPQSNLCGNTIDALGSIAVSVGKESFSPFAQPLIDAAYRCIQSNNTKLKECGFIFVGTLARVYGQDFSIFVEKLVVEIYKCLDQEEFGGLDEYLTEDNGDIGIEDEKDLLDQLNISSAIAIEKEYATDTLGDLLEASADKFPDLKKALQYLTTQCEHFAEGIRKSSINALWRTYLKWASLDNEGPWTPGFPAEEHTNPTTAMVAEAVRTATLDTLETEDERLVAITICDRIAEGLKVIGPRALLNNDNLEKLCTEILMLLNKQHRSQTTEDLEDGDAGAPAESSEYDEVLTDSSFDVVVQVAAALGSMFTPVCPTFLKPILQFCSSSSSTERASAVGAVAEIINGMRPEVTKFTSQLMQALLHRIGDVDIEVRSNAAYGIGLLCYYSEDAQTVTSSYPTILEKLQRLLKKVDKVNKRGDGDDNNARGLANACGCVSRMILKHPNNVPIPDVINVLINRLPLTDGLEENTPVFELIVELVRNQEPTIIGMREQLVQIFAQVFVQEQEYNVEKENVTRGALDLLEKPFETEEIRNKVVELLKFLEQGQPGLVSGNAILAQALA